MVEVVEDGLVVVVEDGLVVDVVDEVGGLDVEGGLEVGGEVELVDELEVVDELGGVVVAAPGGPGLAVAPLRVRLTDTDEGVDELERVVDVVDVAAEGADDGAVRAGDVVEDVPVAGLDPDSRALWTFFAAPPVIPTPTMSPPLTARAATTRTGTGSRPLRSSASHARAGACAAVFAATRARTSLCT